MEITALILAAMVALAQPQLLVAAASLMLAVAAEAQLVRRERREPVALVAEVMAAVLARPILAAVAVVVVLQPAQAALAL